MKNKDLIYIPIVIGAAIYYYNRRTIPKGAIPVQGFEMERYLGTWYEIARIDFKFERHLNNTTANYSINQDGSIRVVNRGFNTLKGEWQEAIGKAKFVSDKNVGKLKVSFFGPFYSGYNVIGLDSEYAYALVAGKNLDYLWILSRGPKIPATIKKDFLKIAEAIGYDTSRLLWVKHSKKPSDLEVNAVDDLVSQV